MAKKKPEKKQEKAEFFEFQGKKAVNLGNGIFATSKEKKDKPWPKEARYFCAILIIAFVSYSLYAYHHAAHQNSANSLAAACPEGSYMNVDGECVEGAQLRIMKNRYEPGQDNLTYNTS